MERTYNYRITAESAGPFKRGDVATAEDVQNAGQDLLAWWKQGGIIAVTGAAPTVTPKEQEAADAAGDQPK